MKNKSLWRRLSKAKATLLQDANLMADVRNDRMVARTYPDPEDAIEAYLRFLYLAAVRDDGAVPNRAVDAIWHAHLSDTRAYQAFCRDVVRKFIHHRPGDRSFAGPDEATRTRFAETIAMERVEFSPESMADSKIGPVGAILIGITGALVITAWLSHPGTALNIALALVAVGSIVWALSSETAKQPALAGGPSDPRRRRATSDGSSSGGGETYYLAGLDRSEGSQNANTHGMVDKTTTSSDGGVDGGDGDGHGGHGGHGGGHGGGDGDGGASCSSCGGGGD